MVITIVLPTANAAHKQASILYPRVKSKGLNASRHLSARARSSSSSSRQFFQ